MKACILAGGQGTRLRPLTENVPKPMTPLLSRPVLEYILRLLRHAGVRDIAVTTAYLAPVIESAFGDGAEWGLRLRYFRETLPLGTAGSVRACAAFLDGEPFLVLSGDCLCDFDLSPLAALQRDRDADAVLALYESPDPLEYGLVEADEEGRVERFVEKPAWGQVRTDTVNTGIYLLHPRVLDRIPENTPYDFSRDLFPQLLRDGKLYARALPGYWCDIGDCGAYLRCTRDLLDGRVRTEAFELDKPAPLPDFPGATICAPCRVSPGARIAPGAVVGPYTVLGPGTEVGECAAVENSVCEGARIGAGAEVRGAILCPGSRVGERARVGEGCVLGDDADVGADAVVSDGARIWPGTVVPPDARVRESLPEGAAGRTLRFAEDGTLYGPLRTEDGVSLGMALAGLTGGGAAALGCDASPVSDTLLCAMESGLRACGGRALRHDAAFEAVARFAVPLSGADAGAFVTAADGIPSVRLFAADGGMPDRSAIRKLEGALLRRDVRRVSPAAVGETRALTGLADLYRAACPSADCAGARVHVEGDFPAAVLLRQLLSDRGAALSAGAWVTWRPAADGMTLSALDEDGNTLDDAALRSLESGAAPEDAGDHFPAPDAGRSPDNEKSPAPAKSTAPDALQRAVRLTARLAGGETLAALAARLPKRASESRDLPLRHPRGAVMRETAALLRETDAPWRPLADAVGLTDGDAAARVQPLADRGALRILAQAQTAEAAAELCDFMEKLVRQADERPGP